MKTKLVLILMGISIFGCKDFNTKNTETDISTIEKDSLSNLSVAKRIAYSNGFGAWKNVSEITFTFNVNRGDTHYERAWTWHPKTGNVRLITANDTVAYNTSKIDSIAKKTDAAFINDKFWLLAPFQIVWDKGITLTEKNYVITPLSKDTLNQLTIQYGKNGGYTPGDAYDFFYDENYKIKEWNYRKSNAETISLSTTWEDYENFNGIEIAKTHKDSTGAFKLYFTNISVKKDKNL